MRKNLPILILLISFLFGGCASSYRSINPNSVAFTTTEEDYGVSFAYRYDLLRVNGNNKYAKKENKKGIRVVAVKISNNSGRTLVFPDDLQLMSGNMPIYTHDPIAVHRQLKQGVPVYLLYLLFTPMNLYTSNESGITSQTPVGLVLGPGLTVFNLSIAASANNKFKEELLRYNLYNTKIEDGETVVGLIGISDIGYSPLGLRVKW